jgi:hypothetical protein
LVQQRLKHVVIVAIDEQHIEALFAQCPDDGDSTEPGTDHDHALTPGHRERSFFSRTNCCSSADAPSHSRAG